MSPKRLGLTLPSFCGVDQTGHIAIGMLVFIHQLMGMTDFIEAIGFGQTRINLASQQKFIHGLGLLIIGQMRALETLWGIWGIWGRASVGWPI